MNKLSIFSNMTNSNIELDNIKDFNFEYKVKCLNEYLHQVDTNDEFIIQLIFTNKEQDLLYKMKNISEIHY